MLCLGSQAIKHTHRNVSERGSRDAVESEVMSGGHRDGNGYSDRCSYGPGGSSG